MGATLVLASEMREHRRPNVPRIPAFSGDMTKKHYRLTNEQILELVEDYHGYRLNILQIIAQREISDRMVRCFYITLMAVDIIDKQHCQRESQ